MDSINVSSDITIDNIITELTGFSHSIDNFMRKSTTLFSSFSDIFPEIETQIDYEINEAQNFIDFFFKNIDGNDSIGIFEEIKSFNHIVNNAVQSIEGITLKDNILFEQVSHSITDVKSLMESIEAIRNVSEELKVYAINSITFANRAGEKGKGYHILAKEYIKISDMLSRKVSEITNGSNLVLQAFSSFDTGVYNLHNFYEESFSKVEKAFTTSSTKMEKGFENLCTILQNIIDRIVKAKNPIGSIMVDMQRQDIIQQQLEHVNESLNDTFLIIDRHKPLIEKFKYSKLSKDEMSELEDIFKLIHTVCNLNINQLGRIQEEINSFNNKTAMTFKTMKELLGDIEEDKSMILDFFIGNGKNSNVDTLFGEPEQIINDMYKNQVEYINQKEIIINEAKGLDGLTKTFNRSFDSITKSTVLISQMQMLTKIEINRNSLDSLVTGSKTSRLSVSEDFERDVPEIINNFDSSLKQVIEYVNQYILEFKDQELILKEILADLDKAKNIIIKSKFTIGEYLTSMLKLTADLASQVNVSITLFKDLTFLENEVFEKVDILSSIKQLVESYMLKIDDSIDLNNWKISNNIMKKLVDKYTVASERDTATNLNSNLSIERSESSNITLF